MAKFDFKAGDDYALALSNLGKESTEISKKMVYEAANVVIKDIRNELENLQEEKMRYLNKGDKFEGVSPKQKKDLLDSLGITPIDVDKSGNTNAKIGFDGYGSYKTKKYPNGLPNQLLARAIESGSSVRKKKPFVRPAVNRSKGKAQEAMKKVFDEEIKKIVK